MTALAVAPAPASPRIPWPRLGWVVWRRYRSHLIATTAVLAALATDLVVTGERMRSAYATYLRCHPANSAHCQFAWQLFHDDYGQPGLLGVVLLFLPGLVGAFVGAPVLAREFETGTYRYAWTQGVGRTRWSIAVLAAGGIGVAVLLAAFGAVVTWCDQPLFASGVTPRLHNTLFPVTGIAGPAWGLAGFGLGVLAGLLWRRVLPALVTAFAAWFGLAYLAANVLRPHYLTPRTTTSLDLPGSALNLGNSWARNGIPVNTAGINAALQGTGLRIDGSGGKVTARPGTSTSVDPVQYLLQHGFQQVTHFQPDSRYWPLQLIEAGWLAALACALLAVTVWLLRRRPG